MKIKVTISTGLAGCDVERTIDLSGDGELEGASDDRRIEILDAHAREEMFQVVEWWWEVIE